LQQSELFTPRFASRLLRGMEKETIGLQADAGRVEECTPRAEPKWVSHLVEKIMGAKAAPPTPFCDFPGLVRHLPMYGSRTLRDLVKKGVISSIRPPGSRKLAFHIPSVERALLRFQKGGIED